MQISEIKFIITLIGNFNWTAKPNRKSLHQSVRRHSIAKVKAVLKSDDIKGWRCGKGQTWRLIEQRAQTAPCVYVCVWEVAGRRHLLNSLNGLALPLLKSIEWTAIYRKFHTGPEKVQTITEIQVKSSGCIDAKHSVAFNGCTVWQRQVSSLK